MGARARVCALRSVSKKDEKLGTPPVTCAQIHHSTGSMPTCSFQLTLHCSVLFCSTPQVDSPSRSRSSSPTVDLNIMTQWAQAGSPTAEEFLRLFDTLKEDQESRVLSVK